MATLYDLSVSLRPDSMEAMELEFNRLSHSETARLMARRHNIRVSQFPERSFFSSERIRLRTHVGTHLDAPVHFFPSAEGKPAKTIDEVPLEWCIGRGVVLDFRRKLPAEPITEYDIAAEFERIGYQAGAGDIVLTMTGGTDDYDHDPRFSEAAAGMNGAALNYLFRLGVRIMGTDSHTMDMPIPLMTERLLKGDRAAYFPVHRAGKLIEWTHAEKLAHLDTLPRPTAFKVLLFPVKVAGGTGAWIRAVAIDDPWLEAGKIRAVDLSLPIMNQSFEADPSRVTTIPRDQAMRIKAKRLGLPVADVVHAGATDDVETSTLAGTHIEAPYHFGPICAGRPAHTVDAAPLDWFYGDAVLVDLGDEKQPGDGISSGDIQLRLDRMSYRLKAGDIVLLRTGAARFFVDDPAFVDLAPRLERTALDWILDQGVRVIGSDCETIDGPVRAMFRALADGNQASFFPIHYAGRERRFCLIAKMNLEALPQGHGFKLAAFPIKLEGCGAAWTRAVALVRDKA